MSATPPRKIAIPPTPSYITSSSPYPPNADSAIADSPDTSTAAQSPNTSFFASNSNSNRNPQNGRRSARQSFATQRTRRGSRATTVLRGLEDDDVGVKLPTLVPGIRPAYSTPLPVLPMAVLSLAMLSELLSANLCTPFILKMVEGFYLQSGYEKNSETEAEVGLWTGNLISVFFITQFFTSLLWSSIADRHGRRAVIVASMAGSAIALIIFGTSESLPEAICIRLVQGIFGGAVGVFRGSIRDITDDTNATRAYAVLGFSWGFGGVMGPILGGVFESPQQNFPATFLSKIPLLQSFPYLLPTILAGIILLTGAIMACFLSWDGGVRGGQRIALPVEKNEPLDATTPGKTSPAPSNRTALPVPSLRNKQSLLSPREAEAPPAIGTIGIGQPHARRDSRASLGTAYGYGGIRSKHPTLAARAAIEAARRVSTATFRLNDDEEGEEEEPLGFAQKFLLANEENTFNINDLWVSAAVAQDTQDTAVFEDDDMEEDGSELDGGEGNTTRISEEGEHDDEENDETPQPSPTATTSNFGTANRGGGGRRIVSGASTLNRSLAGHRFSTSRRYSNASNNVPAIFSNTGLRTPPAIQTYTSPSYTQQQQEERDPFFASPAPAASSRGGLLGGLSVISERPGQSAVETTPLSPNGVVVEKKESTWGMLPLLMISQYGLLALHNTSHDQVFLSFLTTQYKSGGIGLNPANFSFLIALMCIFQLIYQFWLYPRLGPPLGRFSHLQMFRLGCCFYIPSYMALPLLRAFASPDKSGGFLIMTLLTAVTAVRYCGGTLAYTSVMVLINAMSPPPVVGLANGLAQSIVSGARFFGPVIGGTLWSSSINGNPEGYAHGFYVVSAMCAVQLLLSLFIR